MSFQSWTKANDQWRNKNWWGNDEGMKKMKEWRRKCMAHWKMEVYIAGLLRLATAMFVAISSPRVDKTQQSKLFRFSNLYVHMATEISIALASPLWWQDSTSLLFRCFCVLQWIKSFAQYFRVIATGFMVASWSLPALTWLISLTFTV